MLFILMRLRPVFTMVNWTWGGSLAGEMKLKFCGGGWCKLGDKRVCALTLNVIDLLFLRQCF
jgi:hypothetical protein